MSSNESEAACYPHIQRRIYFPTLGLTMPAGFLPVNPVFCYFVETEFFCPLVHAEQQLIHKDVQT